MLALEGVVDVVCRGDVRLAAREGFGDAEEADEIGAVGVEELSVEEEILADWSGRGQLLLRKGSCLLGIGAVDAHFVFLGSIFAEIFDVSENVATTILAGVTLAACSTNSRYKDVLT